MDARRFWDRMARNYDDEVGEETTAITRKHLRREDSVLDYGCARGGYTVALAGDVREIRGIDISPEMIRRARARSAGIRFDVATIFDVDDRFDVVLAYNILHLVENTEGVLERIAAILKPGGRFVSVTVCVNSRLVFRVAAVLARSLGILNLQRFSAAELERHVSRRFEIVETRKFAAHHVLIVARKSGA